MNNTYAIISTKEIGDLCKLKPSATAVLVYTTLLTYAQGKVSCFPSVSTIRERMNNAYSRSAVMKALKWLTDHNFILRGKRGSKERFKLVKRMARRAAEAIAGVSNRTRSTSPIVPDKKEKRREPFFKGGKQNKRRFFSKKRSKGYGRFHSGVEEADNRPKCNAESVWGDWLMANPTYDLSKMSKDAKLVIYEALHSQRAEDKEWREIMGWVPECKTAFEALTEEIKATI